MTDQERDAKLEEIKRLCWNITQMQIVYHLIELGLIAIGFFIILSELGHLI